MVLSSCKLFADVECSFEDVGDDQERCRAVDGDKGLAHDMLWLSRDGGRRCVIIVSREDVTKVCSSAMNVYAGKFSTPC